jgi:oligopeptide/dipeptide ABC transporter ATP-binding protein
MIFQDPYESLNPNKTVFAIVAEPLKIHGLATDRKDQDERVRSALEVCGLTRAEHFSGRRRHKQTILQRELPNPIDLPRGCRFHPRCPDAIPECQETDPQIHPVVPGHEVACIRVCFDSPRRHVPRWHGCPGPPCWASVFRDRVVAPDDLSRRRARLSLAALGLLVAPGIVDISTSTSSWRLLPAGTARPRRARV